MANHFYKTDHLTHQQQIELMEWAKERCDHWWVDQLDCSVSFARQKIEMPFEEIMAKFKPGTHFTVIHRNNDREDFLEISFRTIVTAPDYFLWIILDPKYIKVVEQMIGG